MTTEKRYSLTNDFRFELSDFLNNVWKHKYSIIAFVSLFTAAVTVGALRLPKIYEAKARLLIDPVMPRVLSDGSAVEDISEQARQEKSFYTTQRKIIGSRTVLLDAAERLGLRTDPRFLDAFERTEEASDRIILAALESALSVTLEDWSRVVTIGLEAKNPELVSEIANAVGQAYIDYTLERRLETTRSAAQWLDEQVETFATRLESLESKLNEFKQENLLVSVSLEDRQNMISANLAMLNKRVIETRSQLIRLRAQRDTIKHFSGEDSATAEIPPPLLKNETLSALRVELASLRQSRADESSRYGMKHPIMKGLQQQISETKAALVQEIQASLDNLNAEISALEQTEARFKEEIRKEKNKALALTSLGLQYNKLTREVGTTKDTYESLLKRRTETALSGLLESNFVSWFEKAEPARTPAAPFVPAFVAGGFGLSLLLALAVFALLTILDNTIRDREQLEELLGLTVLGTLPSFDPNSGSADLEGERDLYVHRNPSSSVAESARSIRTNLLLLTADKQANTILITSPRAREGKTTTALSLAISMAQAHNRVLLVDTDLRRPRLHKALSIAPREGLTDVLLGTPIDEAVSSTPVPGVDLLPCGPLPPNPSELLHSARFMSIFKEAASKYDRVIYDSPPINIVSDATILSKMVDGTILVVRANATPREGTRVAWRQLQGIGARLFGVILNQTAQDKLTGAYYYQYSTTRKRVAPESL